MSFIDFLFTKYELWAERDPSDIHITVKALIDAHNEYLQLINNTK